MFPELLEFIWQKQYPAEAEANSQHEYEGRENSSDTTDIELDKTESVSVQIAQYDGRDQKSGYDEKDIDAEETTGYPFGKCMKPYYREDSHPAQSVYVWSVLWVR